MNPYWKALKGSEQCQDDRTGENFLRKRAVSRIDRKQWDAKRDLPHFYVNTVLQDQTALKINYISCKNKSIIKSNTNEYF